MPSFDLPISRVDFTLLCAEVRANERRRVEAEAIRKATSMQGGREVVDTGIMANVQSRFQDRVMTRKTEAGTIQRVAMVEWRTGGIIGGSYRGVANYYEASGEVAPKPRFLRTLLKQMAPSTDFITFDELSELYETGTRKEEQYYGNRDDYGQLYLPLDALYDEMVERGMVLKSTTDTLTHQESGSTVSLAGLQRAVDLAIEDWATMPRPASRYAVRRDAMTLDLVHRDVGRLFLPMVMAHFELDEPMASIDCYLDDAFAARVVDKQFRTDLVDLYVAFADLGKTGTPQLVHLGELEARTSFAP